MQEMEIKVINNFDNLLSTYKRNKLPELLKEKLEQIIPKENSQEKNSCFKPNIKLVENYIIIIYTRTSINLSELNSIKILGYEISIIKLDLNQGEEKAEINISIPLKEPKIITNKNFSVQKYFFYDFIKVSENKNYFHINVFDQLHIYKIYIKDNQLKYNKIELKKFNEKTKLLYLGECLHKDENILEVDLLLKPMNNLMILEISTDDKVQKIEEKIYELKNIQNVNDNNKNIFHKYFRSYCGKFLFTEKETDKNFLIFRDNDGMVMKRVELNISENDNGNNSKYINYFYSYENELYLLVVLPKENEEEEEYIILGIFNLFYNNEKDIYESKLIQKIMIKNEGRNKDYFINTNMDRDITIETGETLIYIQLGKNSSVEKVYQINTNSKDLQISKIICAKFQQWFILLSFIKDDIYLVKLLKDDNNYMENHCILNYIEKEEKEKNNLIGNENNDKIIQSCDINNNENSLLLNENYSSEQLEGILSQINEHIDKIVNDRIEQNKKKFELIKQEYDNKFEMIKQDILAQKKENDILEKRLEEILNRISELDENSKEDIMNKENNININNELNNLKNINEIFKTKNNFQKNDINNLLPFMRRLNSMKMMYPFNFIGSENMFNNQMTMNDPRMAQLFNNGFMNQGNFFHKK